jgi:uncharacterized membrane protein
MKQSIREQAATPQRLWRLFQNQDLSPEVWERSQELADLRPNRLEWRRFLDLLMLGMGAIFLIAGIFFFFAFNWNGMDKFSRFAVVEGAVVVATLFAFFLKLDTWGGRISLAGAAMFMGLALGVIGQTYQTGADSWQLFQTWVMLITAWVLISRWNIMYLIWMVLINITIGLYWGQVVQGEWSNLNLTIILVNLLFLLVWDLLARFTPIEFLKKGRWILYLFAVFMLTHASYLMLDYIFGSPIYRLMEFAPIVYFGLMAILLGMYTLVKRDLLMLTFGALSLLIISICWIGRFLYDTLFYSSNDIFFYFLMMGVVTVSLTVIFVTGLRRLQKAWELQS